jgi:predicted nucleic acid-binding protein
VSDRVFLDANILVSAAWLPDNGLLALWALPDVTLLTSAYAIVEADRNVRTPEQRTRLHRLVQPLEIVDEPRSVQLPAQVRLPAKDVPVLMAAIEASATHLLTGDRDHFGPYFDKSIEGVRILRPGTYLSLRRAK